MVVFLLHLHGVIFVIANLAHGLWWLGFLMGLCMALYQAVVPALLFLCTTKVITYFSIQSPVIRLSLWVNALVFFIFWTDRYSMWIFGIKEGYPLMHPLLPLTQVSGLLLLLPILGKQLLIVLLLLVPASFVLWIWYKNNRALLFVATTCSMWFLCWLMCFSQEKQPNWYCQIKSLPYMVHSTGNNPEIIMKIIAGHIRNIIAQHPQTTTIIMPESALNITDFEKKPALLHLLSEKYTEKPLHLIFGTCRWEDEKYYNSLHWIYNGVLQNYYDKKHAMLITERLTDWMDYDVIRNTYFKDGLSITRSCNARIVLNISEDILFVPYICSELFFNEYPDDCYDGEPIIAIINDTLLVDGYIQKLLLLLGQFRAIQWQREIVYVSYGQSVFIDRQGMTRDMSK